MKYCFLQVSTNLINENAADDIASEYYDQIWIDRESFGYKKPDHFWEIPAWIAELSFTLPDVDKQLCIITEHNQTLPDADIYFASALDVNKHILRSIIESNPERIFCIGGYVDFMYFNDLGNCWWFDSIEKWCNAFDREYVYGTDYSLFAGMSCIPRLTLSTGCKHNCRFCTVPQEVKKIRQSDILQQVKSFRGLDFELVYINDKTFGQCENYSVLRACYGQIKLHNPAFKGFIVQTTCQQIEKFNREGVNLKHDLPIVVVEIGVETYNDNLLRKYRKPQSRFTIDRAIDILEKWGVKIIPNLMIGLVGENHSTRAQTLLWLNKNKKRFFLLNAYNFAVYADADIAKEITSDETDQDELRETRSYHSSNDIHEIARFSKWVYKIGLSILRGI